MSADYEIVARLVVQDATSAGVGKVLSQLGVVESRANSIGRTIGRAFSMLSLVGGVGLGGLISKTLAWHRSIQDATVGIATNMAVVNKMPMSTSMNHARQIMKELRKDAAHYVGSMRDYTTGYQQIYAPARQAGASDEQIRTLVRNTVTAGAAAARGGSTEASIGQATLDVQQALTSGVSSRATPIVNTALMAYGVSLEAFRRMDPAKKIDVLQKALAQYGVGAEEFGRTFTAQWDTLKDNVMSILGAASQPVFDKWADSLRNVNKWIASSWTDIQDMTDKWGPRLLELWDNLISKAGTYAAILGAAAITPTVLSVGAGAAKGLGPLWNDLREVHRMNGGGMRGAASMAGTALGGAGGAAATVAIVFIEILGIFLAIKGALSDYPQLGAFVTKLLYELLHTFEKLGTSFSFLTREGSTLNVVGAELLVFFSGLVTLFDVAVRAISTLVLLFGMLISVVGQLGDVIIAIVSGDKAGLVKSLQNLSATFGEGGAHLKDIWTWGDRSNPWGTAMDAARRADGSGIHAGQSGHGHVPKAGDQNINLMGPITIVAKTELNADPTRVAYTIGSVLEDLGRYRQQARRVPVPR